MEQQQKSVLSDFLKTYKEHTLLWDSSHILYTNKVARKRALDVVFEKYKKFDSSADIRSMRKKFENFRTSYKRERCKVIKARMTGELHEPTLWYYPLMTFLDEERDTNQNDTAESEQSTTINDAEDADDDDNHECYLECTDSPSPPSKRSKPTSVYINESNNDYIIEPAPKVKKAKTVFVEENDDLYQEEPSCSVKHEPSEVHLGISNTESDFYAKTISAQLNELRPKQRFIAEKLISDIIFYGRLEKLKTGTSLNLNNDI